MRLKQVARIRKGQVLVGSWVRSLLYAFRAGLLVFVAVLAEKMEEASCFERESQSIVTGLGTVAEAFLFLKNGAIFL